MPQNPTPQDSHHQLVVHLAERLADEGYVDIKARVKGALAPQAVAWDAGEQKYRPDVTAHRGGRFHIFIVETGETLDEGTNLDRWSLMSHYASQQHGELCIVVPAGADEQAREQMQSLGVEGTIRTL